MIYYDCIDEEVDKDILEQEKNKIKEKLEKEKGILNK
jgi:hypothetical protein